MPTERIDKLTAEQEARFGEFVERWTAIGLCTSPADRPRAEAAIREAYRLGGCKAPEGIVWCGSPFGQALTRAIIREIAKKSGAASVADSVGASVGASVRDSVAASVGVSVADSVGISVRDSVGVSVGVSVAASVGASVWDSVADSVADSVWDSVGVSVGVSVRDSVAASVRDSVGGQHEAQWLSFYSFFREVCNLHQQTDRMTGLFEIAKSAGWWLPHERICWVSERHNVCELDGRQRLHAENGPAVAYPDGWAIWAWHGVRVPQEVIEQPSSLTADRILGEENVEVRRVMLERAGYERVLEKAARVHKDKTGALWRIELSGDEPLMLADVIDPSTGRRYFLRVDPNAYGGLETARAAVASTWRNPDGSLSFGRPEDYVLAAEA